MMILKSRSSADYAARDVCGEPRGRKPCGGLAARSPSMAGAGRGGKTAPLGNQEAIRGDTERGVMVKSPPAPAFIVAQPQFLFEFFIVALDDPAMFGQLAPETSARSSAGKLDSQYFVGSDASFGHSIKSHSSGCGSVRFSSRWAGRTRTAAKRERRVP